MTFKTCTVCRREISAAEWAALPSLGTMPSETDAGEPCLIELRNHDCGGTLAVELVPAFIRPRPCALLAITRPLAHPNGGRA